MYKVVLVGVLARPPLCVPLLLVLIVPIALVHKTVRVLLLTLVHDAVQGSLAMVVVSLVEGNA